MTPEEIIERLYVVDASTVKDMASHIFERQQFSIAAIGNNEVLPAVEKELAKWWGNR